MDIVYIVKESEENEELRYSLRSLKNAPHGKVWLVGYKPKWVKNVHHLDVPQPKGKYTNASNLYLQISLCQDISEDFVLFNDDFFVMKKIKEWQNYHDRTLGERAMDFSPPTNYSKILIGAWDAINRNGGGAVYNFEVHKPMVMNRPKLAFVCSKFGDLNGKRSLYGNVWSVPSTDEPDCKVFDEDEEPDKKALYLSTDDVSFAKGEVGKYIRSRFPEPCEYEKTEEEMKPHRNLKRWWE